MPHALITGGATRIGACLARHMHSSGADVTVQYRHSSAEASALCDDLNATRASSARAVQADFSVAGRAAALLSACVTAPDILLCCASAFMADRAADYTQGRAEDMFRVNVHARLDLAARFMERNPAKARADIIFLSDYIAGITPENFLSYGASCAALHHAAQSLARQAAGCNARVNVLALGHVLPAPTQRQAHFDALCAQSPLKIATPVNDITAAIDFLLTSQSVTGQVMYLDSGARLHHAPYADVKI